MERAGVIQFAPQYIMFDTSSLLKYLLFFDKLFYHETSLNEVSEMARIIEFINSKTGNNSSFVDREALRQFNKLEELGLVQKVSPTKYNLSPLINESSFSGLNEIQKELTQVTAELSYQKPESNFNNIKDHSLFTKQADLKEKLEVLETMAILQINDVENRMNNEYVPIFRNATNLKDIRLTSKKMQVLNVLFDQFLIPDNNIPFEQFLEIKQDSELQMHYHALRVFISELSLGSLSIVDINEKIDWLMQCYDKALKLHKAKLQFTTMEIVVTTLLDLVFMPITAMPITTSKALLSLYKSNIQFSESHLNMPGKEVAYIHKVNERLTN